MFGYYKLKRFFRKLQKLVVNIIVVGFILLVTIQLILANPGLKDSLVSKIPQMDYILAIGQQPEFDAPAKEVFSLQNQSKEQLTIKLQNRLQLSNVKLVVNDQVVDDFKAGIAKAKIKAGDKIAIDARGYKQGLWFKITKMSTQIDNFAPQQQFWIKNEYKVLGEIEKLNKF
ncbi:hypothetical protein [Halanaerobaculum tunisiense]